jgi:hypothetical protein
MKVGIFQEEEGLFLVGALERCEAHGEKFIDALQDTGFSRFLTVEDAAGTVLAGFFLGRKAFFDRTDSIVIIAKNVDGVIFHIRNGVEYDGDNVFSG